jgi:hypothetical protein
MQFNARPTLVTLHEYVVLSSNDGLAKDLIDAIRREKAGKATPLVGVRTLAEIDVGQAAALLRANRENMVRGNMVEKGNSRQKAESDIDLLTGLLKRLGGAKLSMGEQDGRPCAGVEVELNLSAEGGK